MPFPRPSDLFKKFYLLFAHCNVIQTSIRIYFYRTQRFCVCVCVYNLQRSVSVIFELHLLVSRPGYVPQGNITQWYITDGQADSLTFMSFPSFILPQLFRMSVIRTRNGMETMNAAVQPMRRCLWKRSWRLRQL